jgi:hypothetical protein
MQAGDVYTVDFYLDLPELYPASFLLFAGDCRWHADGLPDVRLDRQRHHAANGPLRGPGLRLHAPALPRYAEARAAAGPNPFHEHEYEADEFQAALQAQFANVSMLLQNRSECFAFYPATGWRGGEVLAEPGADRAEEANFFLALCSNAALPAAEPLVYVPRVANLLRERERHIEKLQGELAQKERWLAEVMSERDRALELALENQRWAQQTGAELDQAREAIAELQARFAAEQVRAQESINALEAENQRKTEWAMALAAEVDVLRGQIAMVIASRWVRAGHRIGLGPPLPGLDNPAQ